MYCLPVCLLLSTLCVLQDTLALPPPTPVRLGPHLNNTTIARSRRAGFKSRYVYQNGQMSTTDYGGSRIQVMATYSVSDTALRLGATTVYRMTRHMSTYLFQSIASKIRIGIFSKSETEIVYLPQLAHPAGCSHDNCQGSCHTGCTVDGRLYSDLAGSGGLLTTILDDNILCNSNDPYFQKSNILVHEFAHSIQDNAVTADQRQRIRNAFNTARSRSTWSWYYPMRDEHEYWAVGTGSFFNSEKQTANDMDICKGQRCWSEAAVRYNLYEKDQTLYYLLVEIYNNNQNIEGGIGPCTQ